MIPGIMAGGAAAAGGGGGSAAYHDAVAADDPVLWLRFGENVSGNPVNSGSATLTSSSYGAGLRGKNTLCGDADNYSVAVTEGSGVRGPTFGYAAGAIGKTSGFTIEAIVLAANLSAMGAIYSGGTTNNAAELRIISGKINLIRRGVAVVATADTTLVAGKCYHVACTVADDGTYAFYLDGVLDGTGAGSTSFSDSQNFGYVGFEDLSQSTFVGLIGEVAVYHSALSPERILAHASAVDFKGAWVQSKTTSFSGNSGIAANQSVRQRILAAWLTPCTKVKFTLAASSGTEFTVDKIRVAKKAASGNFYDYASAPISVTVGGSAGGSALADAEFTTDPADMTVASGEELVLGVHTVSGLTKYATGSLTYGAIKDGDDVDTPDTSGFTEYSGSGFIISKIECFIPS